MSSNLGLSLPRLLRRLQPFFVTTHQLLFDIELKQAMDIEDLLETCSWGKQTLTHIAIAGTWVGPFALYSGLLSWRIVSQRLRSEVFIGDKSSAKTSSPAHASSSGPDPLEVAIRCHANFLENVPLAFIFLILAELNGGNRKALHYTMATLFALRLAHSEAGLRLQGKFGNNGIGRPVGYFGSAGVLLGLAGYASYLTKGYWG